MSWATVRISAAAKGGGIAVERTMGVGETSGFRAPEDLWIGLRGGRTVTVGGGKRGLRLLVGANSLDEGGDQVVEAASGRKHAFAEGARGSILFADRERTFQICDLERLGCLHFLESRGWRGWFGSWAARPGRSG